VKRFFVFIILVSTISSHTYGMMLFTKIFSCFKRSIKTEHVIVGGLAASGASILTACGILGGKFFYHKLFGSKVEIQLKKNCRNLELNCEKMGRMFDIANAVGDAYKMKNFKNKGEQLVAITSSLSFLQKMEKNFKGVKPGHIEALKSLNVEILYNLEKIDSLGLARRVGELETNVECLLGKCKAFAKVGHDVVDCKGVLSELKLQQESFENHLHMDHNGYASSCEAQFCEAQFNKKMFQSICFSDASEGDTHI